MVVSLLQQAVFHASCFMFHAWSVLCQVWVKACQNATRAVLQSIQVGKLTGWLPIGCKVPISAGLVMPQVVLVLDNREQFGNHVGGRVHGSRVDSRNEGQRQLRNLGVNAEVGHYAHMLLVSHANGHLLKREAVLDAPLPAHHAVAQLFIVARLAALGFSTATSCAS